MLRWTYPVLAVFILIVIGLGLGLTLKEGIEVASFVKPNQDPERGRLMMHMKNVTRISGSVQQIHDNLKDVIPYETARTADYVPEAANWKEFVKNSVTIDSTAKHVIIIPSIGEEALAWALPAVFYAKYNNSPLVFADELAANRNLLQGRKAFLIGPKGLLSDADLEGLEDYERISASTPADLAVKISRYRDNETGFGWGRQYHRRTGYFQYVVTTPFEALQGLAALPLAGSNAAAVLYANEQGGLPGITDAYMWSQRSDWFVTPSEGPFRHFWVVSERLSYAAQGRMDFSIEKASYPDMGHVALGPLEAAIIIFIALGIAGGIFILVHSSYMLPGVMLPMKISWTLGSMLLPVLGVILYFNAYRRPVYKKDKMMHWLRPQNIQSAAATMMGFGFGAPAMIAVAWLFAFFGFPVVYSEAFSETIFWLGAGMPVMMLGMYIGAIILAAFLVQFPMKKSMMEMENGEMLWSALKVTFLSMTAVSLGMMTFTWWMMMYHMPMMPQEDDVMWFGTIWIASFVGFLVAWPLNWIMIRKNLKNGNT